MSQDVGTLGGEGGMAAATGHGRQGVLSRLPKPSKLRMSTVRMVAAAFVLSAFAFTFAFTTAWGQAMDRLAAFSSTSVFATMDLKTLDGYSYTSENLRNARITLLNVWGTSCPPCINEMPELDKLNQSYEPGQIQVVGLVSDITNSDGEVDEKKVEEARQIVQTAGVTYPSLVMDKATYAFVMTNIIGTPTTFFVDSGGKIVKTVTGANNLEGWKQHVDEALASLDQQ